MIPPSIRFALHTPPRKLLSRAYLTAKRQFLSRAGRAGWVCSDGMIHPAEPLSEHAPTGLFVAQRHAVERLAPSRFAFTFLNHREEFELPIDWHREALQIGTRLWLLNLHYLEYLPDLEDADFEALLADWIRGNPRNGAAYWTYNWNSYALSLRVVAIMKEVAERRERLAPPFLAMLARSLTNQMRFLAVNIEHDVGGNHIIKNAKALIWAGHFFDGARARRWRTLGERLLARELPRQILPDGVHFERSPSYHAAVFVDLLEIRHVAGVTLLDGRLDDYLSRMAPPLADLAHPDGLAALFNDAGLTMSFAPGRCLGCYSDLIAPAPRPQSVFAYPDAGYFGVRNAAYALIVDFGPIGPDELPGHSHGDVGSLELSVAGVRVIVDQGVYEYSQGHRRERSRSAESHNVLHIAGGDQAEFFGAFRCGRRPRVAARFEARKGGFDLAGRHDGYASLPGRPVARRRVQARPTRISIEDRVEGHATGVSLSFLLHPEATVASSSEGVEVRRGDGHLVISSTADISVEDAVWWPNMGIEQPTRRLRLELAPGTLCATTEIRILAPAEAV